MAVLGVHPLRAFPHSKMLSQSSSSFAAKSKVGRNQPTVPLPVFFCSMEGTLYHSRKVRHQTKPPNGELIYLYCLHDLGFPRGSAMRICSFKCNAFKAAIH